MFNKPGMSWGVNSPVNLIRSSKGWIAVHYSPDGYAETIKVFNPKTYCDFIKMIEKLTIWNYGTCELCPVVRTEMDYG